MTETSTEYRISPRVNILEDSNAFTIEAELPGVAKEDVEITLEDGALTLKGTRTVPEIEGDVRLRERKGTAYYRSFMIDDTIDRSKVDAVMKDGVLTVTLNKSEGSKPQKISIN